MTLKEIQKLLDAAQPAMRLLYEVAFTTGLRARELSSLKVKNLNHEKRALILEPEWKKNRKPGIQPLPSSIYESLKASTAGKKSGDPLLYVPSHPSREMDKDLATARNT